LSLSGPASETAWQVGEKFRSQPAEDNEVSNAHLDPEEDSELRRLHVLRAFGSVASSVTSRYEALRGRDRRRGVRDPDEGSVAAPVQSPDWSSSTAAGFPMTGQVPSAPSESGSVEERFITDPRELLGDRPESRRGRGIFRR
jgi:hypothetical protein